MGLTPQSGLAFGWAVGAGMAEQNRSSHGVGTAVIFTGGGTMLARF